jgi:TRAP-type C4-dicarboxylate transport system permease large subunit
MIHGYTRVFFGGRGGGFGVGPLIPPSLVDDHYGVLAEESIGQQLFNAGIIPGRLALGFCVLIVAWPGWCQQ